MAKANRSLNSPYPGNLEITNTVYILFRGSMTLADALDDGQMIFLMSSWNTWGAL